jgi:uncharacterized membrane protein
VSKAIAVLALVFLGLFAGSLIALFGVEPPWAYAAGGVVAAVGALVLITRSSGPRS